MIRITQIAQMYGKSIIYGFFLVLFVGVSSASYPPQSLARKSVSIGEKWFTLEVADTPEKRARGLMWRSELPLDRGMLFVYPGQGKYRIWMKNTKIPLQVIWVGDDYRVQAVKTLLPCGTGPCLSFGIEQKSLYVIELNAEVPGIEPGMQVNILN